LCGLRLRGSRWMSWNGCQSEHSDGGVAVGVGRVACSACHSGWILMRMAPLIDSPEVREAVEAVARVNGKYSRAVTRSELLHTERDTAIRAAYERGASLGDIARVTGMTRSNVSRIVNFK